jgi:small-conductance mechanosensitive channel
VKLSSTILMSLALPVGLTLVGLLVGLVVRRTVFARLARLAAGTRSSVDDRVISGLTRVLERSALTLVILVVTWAAARLAAGYVLAQTRPVHGNLPSATLLPNLARLVVLIVGLTVVLETLGISITPIITALGVGGLAVALALQDTLANLFAGMHILMARQVRPGDYVALDTGEKGYVQDVTWRYTTIRQLPNNITVVPNAKLASAITTNFYLPERELAVLVQVGVAYASDLDRVERVTIDVGREVMREVQGGVVAFEPFIRYHTFGDSSIQFSVILRGREFVDQYLITHEFIKRLHRRYRAEGIEIPFPMRTVELKGGAAPAPPRG